MGKAKILVIDDEPSILNVVTAYLRSEGYDYQTAGDGVDGLSLIKTFSPDLIILDIMLPGMDGIEVLSQLRRESNAYVIMLTARAEETDKLVGLSVGADDYLTKPFSPRELMARVKAALRRYQKPASDEDRKIFSFAHVRIDSGSRRAWVAENEIDLTSLEFDLLVALAGSPWDGAFASSCLKRSGVTIILATCAWWTSISGICAKNLAIHSLRLFAVLVTALRIISHMFKKIRSSLTLKILFAIWAVVLISFIVHTIAMNISIVQAFDRHIGRMGEGMQTMMGICAASTCMAPSAPRSMTPCCSRPSRSP